MASSGELYSNLNIYKWLVDYNKNAPPKRYVKYYYKSVHSITINVKSEQYDKIII